MDGNGVAQDGVRAVALYERGCDVGFGQSCFNLALDYQEGKTGDPNESKATLFFEKACDNGEAKGCFNAGISYRRGRGVAQNAEKSAILFQKACDGGAERACGVKPVAKPQESDDDAEPQSAMKPQESDDDDDVPPSAAKPEDGDHNAVAKERIEKRYSQLMKACLDRHLKEDPDASGTMTIKLEVAPTGRVSKADVLTFDPDFASCVKSQAERWRFSSKRDPNGAAVSAKYEVSFRLPDELQ